MGWLLCAVGVVALTIAALPSTGFSRWASTLLFGAQIIAFPRLLGLGIVLFGLVTALFFRSARIGGAFLVAAGVIFAAFPSTVPWVGVPTGASEASGDTLTVATLNSQATLAQSDIEELAQHYSPDVIVLPDASPDRAARAAQGTEYEGTAYAGELGEIHAEPTTMLLHPRLGELTPADGPTTTLNTPSLALPAGVDIIGIHTLPPVPEAMEGWRADLDSVLAFGEDPTRGPLILAGDFNATLRHGPLAARTRLVDTAQECAAAPEGTWPASRSSLLRTPIDHVFVTPDIQVLDCAVRRVGAGDHRAYVATLRLPG
ncbi:hypothetical protein Clow_00261 [Corynebacterium lowii]|uniref:Endonuclease/exonuclease/phosphatase domain-containing protein n=1 Tax=Corynebacterium lowii TaxID=1544413 RepID=A0A0Q0ULJ4_9CORY|nr:hypothetical protein Clow_00261 [Corynebacterium lowii]